MLSHVAGDMRKGVLERVTPPAEEPLALSDVKAFLHVNESGKDAVLTRMLAAAREAAEEFTHLSLVTQSWKLGFDGAAPMHVGLPRGPVQSIVKVSSFDVAGAEVVLPVTTYFLKAGKRQMRFWSQAYGHRVEVVFSAGFGAAAAVPAGIKQGMLHHIAAMFAGGEGAVLPETARVLYASWREEVLA